MRYSLGFLKDYMSAKGIMLIKHGRGNYTLENPELNKPVIARFKNMKELETYIRSYH